MCGICGVVEHEKSVDIKHLHAMTKVIRHRGPEDTKHYVSDNLGIGFNRLSFIDLKGGMQPLFNEDEQIILACNGEIYNYIELKEMLLSKGHKFRSNTDVEVIIHLYEECGMDFVSLLNGQFAFFIHDKRKKISICARDQFGIAPFFYTKVSNTFIFGSEIKSILAHDKVKKEVNLVGLDQIFTFPGLISPTTMFKGINSLENGHMLILNDDGEIKDVEYYDFIYPQKGEIEYLSDSNFYTVKLDELLSDSIKLRLRADVPIGLYISGGLDSSIIAVKLNKLTPEIKRKSFSMDFDNDEMSEKKYQDIIVNLIGSEHHCKKFLISDIVNRLRDVIYYSECPLKESYNTASYCLSDMVRKSGIKAFLSGEGADELFGGYVGYKFDKIRELRMNSADDISPEEREIRRKIWGDETYFYEKNYYDFTNIKKSIYAKQVLTEYENINCLNHKIIDPNKIKDLDILHKRSYLDYKLRLVDHLISDHGDRMAYANSVEGRFPFLDKNIFDFATKVPPDLMVHDFEEKYILKKMAENLLPSTIINREKFGFVAPGSIELLRSNDEYINDILSYERIKRQGVFDPAEIEKLKVKYREPGFKLNLPFESDLLIVILTFGIFLDVFNL